MVEEMLRGIDKRVTLLPTVLVVILLFTIVIPLPVKADGPTLVQVSPSNTTVSALQTFSLNISCIPSQPIKSFELKISFDPSLLQANSVTGGTIFSGYSTFFNDGTIDNIAGSIINIYNLIIGPENTSNPGTLVTISFTAKKFSGTSTIDLYDVGVTDDLGYVSITVSDAAVTVIGENQPGGGGYTPGDGGTEPPVEPEQNLPPNAPAQPIGPTFIERGVGYEYTSFTSDLNGDRVRLRFDWGDGNFSNWSDLVDSNMTVSASHIWDARSTFSVRVIAQDENESNSSWSLPLNVTVSEQETGEVPPVIDIIAPDNGSANQAIFFDVSVSVGPDSEIISYTWDFGDGTTGTGKNPSHVYTKPGVYSVILTVVDNNGKTSLKTFLITIGAGAETTAQNQESSFSYLGIVLILVVCIGIGLFIYFRKKLLKTFSNRLVVHHERKIEHLSTKIADMSQRIDHKPVTKHYVSDNQKLSKSIEPSIEEQVDRVLLSKIEEKIDKL